MRLRDAHRIAYAMDCSAISPETRKRHDYELRLWERHTSDPEIEVISPDTFNSFREAMAAEKYVPQTIEVAIGTYIAILRGLANLGLSNNIPLTGAKLRVITQPPDVPAIEDLSRAYEFADYGPLKSSRDGRYWRAFFATLYFTAFRLRDMFNVRWDQFGRDAVSISANKTGKIHRIPLHPVLRRVFNEYRTDNKRARPFTLEKCQLYRELRRICSAAKVPLITPQAVRRLSANQYEMAHGGAGMLILGQPLPGATRFYLDVPAILRAASVKIAVPESMMTPDDRRRINDRESQLLLDFRRLPDQEKESVLTIVRKMA